MNNKDAKDTFSSLRNFSTVPPPELWDNIEAKLRKPKKKKRFVLWWSIAASLVVGLSIPSILYFNSHSYTNFSTERVVVHNDENNVRKDFNSSLKNAVKEKLSFNRMETGVAEKQIKRFSKETKISSTNQSDIIKKTLNPKTNKETSTLIVNNITKKTNPINTRKTLRHATTPSFSSKTKAVTFSGKSKRFKNNLSIPLITQQNDNNQNLSSFENKEKGISANNTKSSIGLSGKTKISNGIGRDKMANTTAKDSLAGIKSEIAQLEQALVVANEKKIKKISIEHTDKWSLQVFAGVASSQNYNTQKALGTSIDPQKSTAYGVKANYKLAAKWKISSGIKINELGQKIEGISYYNQQKYSGTVTARIPMASDMSIQNSKNNNYELVTLSSNKSYLFATNNAADNGFDKGNITQNLKYFEMPLEISYAFLSKKKTNIMINTGGFVGKLISNEILLNADVIGQNKNANQYVYGTLLSSTVQYEFYKKTRVFVEPGMNYYINPVENQSFSQFQWMCNIGLGFSF